MGDGSAFDFLNGFTLLEKGTVSGAIQDVADSNYVYDAVGNLVKDKTEKIDSIYWTVYGKISEIAKTPAGSNTVQKIKYTYDASGNRISKLVIKQGADSTYTQYVRDAQGNVMAVYSSNTLKADSLLLNEHHLYGSSRLGIVNRELNVSQPGITGTSLNLMGMSYLSSFERGRKVFELSNHFGNVLVTVSDKKLGFDLNGDGKVDYYGTDVISASDYYPFGMGIVGRAYEVLNSSYRYGFNGQEKTSEIGGDGYTAEFWQYDARLGRRWNVDPVFKEYESPYAAFGNNPIIFIDPNGLDTVNASQRRNAVPGDKYKMKDGTYVTKGEYDGWFSTDGVVVSFKSDVYTTEEKKKFQMLLKIYTGVARANFEDNQLRRNRILEYKIALTKIQNTTIGAFNDAAIIIATSGLGTSFTGAKAGIYGYGKLGSWIGPVAKNISQKVLAARGDFSKIDWFDVITSSVKDKFGLGLAGKVTVEILNAGVNLNYKKGIQVAFIGGKSDGAVIADITSCFLKIILGEVMKELKSSKTTDDVYKIVIDQLKTSLKNEIK